MLELMQEKKMRASVQTLNKAQNHPRTRGMGIARIQRYQRDHREQHIIGE
jgi:hypothetical protein